MTHRMRGVSLQWENPMDVKWKQPEPMQPKCSHKMLPLHLGSFFGFFLTFTRNKNKITIDLHGFQVQEAMDLLERLLAYHKKDGKPLEIITGKGLHSMGRARIRPAVEQFLKENRYKYVPFEGEGGFWVYPK